MNIKCVERYWVSRFFLLRNLNAVFNEARLRLHNEANYFLYEHYAPIAFVFTSTVVALKTELGLRMIVKTNNS